MPVRISHVLSVRCEYWPSDDFGGAAVGNWDCITDRMLNNQLLRDYFFLGTSADYGFPVIVPRKRDSPHIWVMGAPGTGKTGLYLALLSLKVLLLATARY